jgi:hypothetical protein
LEHFATCFERLDPEADFWINCPLEYLIQLFNSPKLALSDELKLWQFVNVLVKKRPDLNDEKPEQQRQLIEVVKYPLISSDILLTLITEDAASSSGCNEIVLKMVTNYACEALQARALFLEGFQHLAEKTAWKFLRKYHFELRNTGAFFPEEGGLFEWLGRDKGQTSDFNVTLLLKYVKLTSSALHPDVTTVNSCFRGHSFKLKNSQLGWIQYDFGNHAPRYYKVRAYQFKHGNFYRQNDRTECFMRSWTLEGSRDGKTWIVLDQKTNDTTIQAKNTFYTFEVNPPVAGIVSVRLKSTGPDDHGHLALCFLDLDLLYTN